ncbi:MAG: dehydrogenase [Desulfobacterales bacterium]|nr:dehydrogenase [Desulfobacterales bacterium]MBF0395796.1 dehydrogenase [Desulfobacterales bacterium]
MKKAKQIVSISLGSSRDDYAFGTEFLGHDFYVKRVGADGNLNKAAELLFQYEDKADAIGLGSVKFPYSLGSKRLTEKQTQKLEELGSKLKIPVTTGDTLRKVFHEWSLRHIHFKLGNNYFTNNRVLFFSGMVNYIMAKVLSEYTDNLQFADPIMEDNIPKLLNSLKELEMYAEGLHEIMKWVPTKRLTSSAIPLKIWNDYILRKAIQKATVLVVPGYDFYKYLEKCTLEELVGKTVITSTAYADRLAYLKERGVDVVIDNTPKVLEQVIGVNILEAMIISHLGKPKDKVTSDDFLEIISEHKIEPRVVYLTGEKKRVNRFAFVIHPLSQEFLKKDKAIDLIARVTPPAFMDTIERVIAYSPPFIYSKITGVKSPTGVEAEGWLITVGGTPKQMLEHPPEFTYKRLLQAAKMAKKLGAQIMGLGAFTKVVGDAGVTVAKLSDIPITTGNSYSASAALWAAADASRRMGFLTVEKGRKLKGKAMVVGATGAIGAVCSRLLVKAFEEVYMVARDDAKLLALKESILEETPDAILHMTTRHDRYLEDMDVIVTATSGAGKTVLDIMKVKPGCVITDVARPLDLSPEDVAKRPDVLVIESGEILLPGSDVKMKNIGLPGKIVYACLAETIVLALEGRFEIFTIGRNIEWEKVREIYKLGIKHGMELAAISGTNGVYSDDDIKKVRDLAIIEREKKASSKKLS